MITGTQTTTIPAIQACVIMREWLSLVEDDVSRKMRNRDIAESWGHSPVRMRTYGWAERDISGGNIQQ